MSSDEDFDDERRWKRRLRLARGLAFLLATAVYAAGQAGRAELRELCKQGAQPKVYKTVSAEGYFDGGVSCLPVGCWTILTSTAYRFIEFEKRDSKPWHLISEDGFYRLSKVRRHSSECDESIYADMAKSLAYTKFIESGYCLALEKLEGERARYGVFSEKLQSVRLKRLSFQSTIMGRHFFVRDLRTEQIVAERNTYLLSRDLPPAFSSFRNVVGCRDVGVISSLPDLINVESYIRPE